MIWVARIAGTLVLVFSFVLGFAALAAPDRAAEALGFAPLSDMGRNSIRSDIVAFAWGSALASAAGLFAGRPHLFYGPAVLFGLAASGRSLDVVVSGPPEGVAPSIITELIMVGLALTAAKWLPKPS